MGLGRGVKEGEAGSKTLYCETTFAIHVNGSSILKERGSFIGADPGGGSSNFTKRGKKRCAHERECNAF